jgi:ubiquitin C-terminal hydrolase
VLTAALLTHPFGSRRSTSHTTPLSRRSLTSLTSLLARTQELNKDNPLGLQGQLAEAYGSLMNSLWKEGASTVSPRSFKSKLARFAPNFSGYNQQDAQVSPSALTDLF